MTTLEGNELRRAVAEEQGWRVKAVDESDVGIINTEVRFVVYAPNGERFIQSQNDLDTTWELLILWADIPDYPNDLNTIKDAPLDEDVSLEINNPLPYDRRREWDVVMTTETGESYRASHSEPATAFWNAWLEMRKAGRDG